MARLFMRAGCTVAITSTKQSKIDALLQDVATGSIHGFVCDLRHSAEVNDVVLQIKEKLGLIDILINNVSDFPDAALCLPVAVSKEEGGEGVDASSPSARSCRPALHCRQPSLSGSRT